MNRRQRRRGVEPTNINGQLATRTEFYKTELFKMVKGIFKVTQPVDWELDYLLNILIHRGYIIIADTSAGVIPVKGTLSGFNYWDYATKAVCTMPVLESFERTIGVDCQILFLERTRYRSFYNFNKIVEIFAYKLAAADAGIDVNLFNSRVAYMAEAESKGQADTIKALVEKAYEGEPLVVYRSDAISKTGLQLMFNNLKQNYIADMIQDSKRSIVNEFLTFIGVDNANTDKRERLITNEVEANNVELACNTALWKENLRICCERINTLFPDINFNIELKFDPEKTMLNSTVEQEDENESD